MRRQVALEAAVGVIFFLALLGPLLALVVLETFAGGDL